MKILIFYSGGKDSQACLIHSVKKYGVENCEAVFCDTGWENPLTYEHIVNTTKMMGVKLVILKSQKYDGMIDLATKKKRFPSTKARFCTEELKSKPAIDYVLSHNENVIVIEGIRASESFSRSKMQAQCTYFKYYFEAFKSGKKHNYRKKDVLEWCRKHNADKIRPLFDWNSQQVVDYIISYGQTPNPLYYQGFKRVGCFPCIMANKREIKLIIENHNKRFEELKNYENQLNTSFFPPDYIPKKFCSMSKNGVKYPHINDVEKYILGKNVTLDMFEETTPSCMSVYNLCE